MRPQEVNFKYSNRITLPPKSGNHHESQIRNSYPRAAEPGCLSMQGAAGHSVTNQQVTNNSPLTCMIPRLEWWDKKREAREQELDSQYRQTRGTDDSQETWQETRSRHGRAQESPNGVKYIIKKSHILFLSVKHVHLFQNHNHI